MENTWSQDLTAAAKTLSDICGRDGVQLYPSPEATLPDTNNEAAAARRKIRAIASRLQALLADPPHLIQQLSTHVQLLACLKWLVDFQVLACIPLQGSLPMREVADIAGVPEHELRRVIRAVSPSGVLYEPQVGFVEHTLLSAQFVTNLRNLDAIAFLAATITPAALQMSSATSNPLSSAYRLADTSHGVFTEDCQQNERLQRQWDAYSACMADTREDLIDVLHALNWRALGAGVVVDVCAESTDLAASLIMTYPSIRIILQSCPTGPLQKPFTALNLDPGGSKQVTLDTRAPGAAQAVLDAAVYILRFTRSGNDLLACILTELNIHMAILAVNPSATIILAPPLLPECGQAADVEHESMTRLFDVVTRQLTTDGALELSELVDVVSTVRDDRGRLVVVNKLRSSRTGLVLALAIRYSSYRELPTLDRSMASNSAT